MSTLRKFVSRVRQTLARPPHPVAASPVPAPTPPSPRRPADEAATAQLAELREAGRHEDALVSARAQFARVGAEPDPDRELLREVQRVAATAGAISLHLDVLRRRVQLDPEDAGAREQLRIHEGRWRDSDPGWSPTIAPEALASLPATRGERPRTGRVLHLLKIGMPQRQSGYSMRSLYTLVGQQRAGLDPVAVTALDFPLTVGVQDAPEQETVAGVRYRHLLRGEVPRKEPWDSYLDAYATELAPVASEEDPDLIHVHSGNRGYEPALVALTVGRALDIPVVYEVRGFFESLWTGDTSVAETAEIYDRRWAAEVRCMREAAAVVTLSESMKQDIVARGIPEDHVHVVPNGVDPTAFVPRPRDPGLTRRLGLEDQFVFGYVSNLDHYREGQELLVEAAVELRSRGIPATALVVGDGRRRALLEGRAAELGAGEAVVFTGKVPHDEVADHYAQIDVFVVPRVDERAARLVTPLKPYEAMALGVPLVVSDLPALQEITGDGARGETFVTGDATSLADVLERLWHDPDRRVELAATAREWVLSERDWARNGERYGRIYDEVLNNRR